MALFGPPDVGKLEAEGNSKKLIKALQYKDYYIQYQAAAAMGRLRNPEFAEPLLNYVVNDLPRCKTGLWALGRIKDRRVIPTLLGLLREMYKHGEMGRKVAEQHIEIYEGILETLGEIGDPLAIDDLIIALDCGWVTPAKVASKALVKIGAEAVAPLQKAYASTSFSESKQMIAKTMGEIGTRSALAALELMVESGDKQVRAIAVEYLDKNNLIPAHTKAFINYAIIKGDFDILVNEGQKAVPYLDSALQAEMAKGEFYADKALCAQLACTLIRIGVLAQDLEDIVQKAIWDYKAQEVTIVNIQKVGEPLEPILTRTLTSCFIRVCNVGRGIESDFLKFMYKFPKKTYAKVLSVQDDTLDSALHILGEIASRRDWDTDNDSKYATAAAQNILKKIGPPLAVEILREFIMNKKKDIAGRDKLKAIHNAPRLDGDELRRYEHYLDEIRRANQLLQSIKGWDTGLPAKEKEFLELLKGQLGRRLIDAIYSAD